MKIAISGFMHWQFMRLSNKFCCPSHIPWNQIYKNWVSALIRSPYIVTQILLIQRMMNISISDHNFMFNWMSNCKNRFWEWSLGTRAFTPIIIITIYLFMHLDWHFGRALSWNFSSISTQQRNLIDNSVCWMLFASLRGLLWSVVPSELVVANIAILQLTFAIGPMGIEWCCLLFSGSMLNDIHYIYFISSNWHRIVY